jgi:SAM-dependent methyltransferase
MELNNKSILVDNDPQLKYETVGYLQRALEIIYLPILNNIPEKLFHIILSFTSKKGKEVKKHAAKYKSLELMYSFEKKSVKNSLLKNITNYLWFNLENPKALRNRLKLVKKILKKELEDLLDKNCQSINILSLGSGSGRSIIENIIDLSKMRPMRNLNVTLIDKDPDALKYSKEFLKKFNIKANFNFICDNLRNADKHVEIGQIDIIEIVGILDYLDDHKSQLLIQKARSLLKNGGLLITANIRKNRETKFVTNAMKWPMVYREPEEFENLLKKSNFKQYKIIYEPILVHGVAAARK